MDDIKPNFIFNFEELTNTPNKILNKFCKKFKFKKTLKTEKIINSIKKKPIKNPLILKKLNIRKNLIIELNKIRN